MKRQLMFLLLVSSALYSQDFVEWNVADSVRKSREANSHGSIYSLIDYELIQNVSEEFKTRYYQSMHEYNPLHVGNTWQYNDGETIRTDWIEKDTLVNSRMYYKKMSFSRKAWTDIHFFNWERNDTANESTYMLDIEDIDYDGIYEEELLLDSMEVPNGTIYDTYRDSWKDTYLNHPPYPAVMLDSTWIVVAGDTVMSRYVLYLGGLKEVRVADKYGIVYFYTEFNPNYLAGAIINGVEFGTIVSVEEHIVNKVPGSFVLVQNYPNPFNSSTSFQVSVNSSDEFQIIIYNSLGQEVKKLFRGYKSQGKHNFIWTGLDNNYMPLPSGVYFITLISPTLKLTNKAVLLK